MDGHSKIGRDYTMPKRKAASQYPCVVCSVAVRDDDEGLTCDNCQRWQHRACRSGK